MRIGRIRPEGGTIQADGNDIVMMFDESEITTVELVLLRLILVTDDECAKSELRNVYEAIRVTYSPEELH